MENLNKKLQSTNTVYLSQVFSKLIKNISDKPGDKQKFQFLITKVLNDNSLVSDIAIVSVVALVEQGNFQADHVLAEILTSPTTSKSLMKLYSDFGLQKSLVSLAKRICLSLLPGVNHLYKPQKSHEEPMQNAISVIKIISNLLYLQIKQKSLATKENTFFSPSQHPFIKLLREHVNICDVQVQIFNEIAQNFRQDLRLAPEILKLYYPVYLFCLCSPTALLELSLLRHKLWTFLLKHEKVIGADTKLSLCCWMQAIYIFQTAKLSTFASAYTQVQHEYWQTVLNKVKEDTKNYKIMNTQTNIELAGILTNEALQQNDFTQTDETNGYLLLAQLLAIYNMILKNMDCRPYIETIIEILPKTEFGYHNVCLLIISKILNTVSPVYLKDVLLLCYSLLQYKHCQPYSYLAVKSYLLSWLSAPSVLTKDAMNIATNILKLNDDICTDIPIITSEVFINKYHYFIFCNPEIFLTLQLERKVKSTCVSEFSYWLEDLEKAPLHFLKHIFSFLCGMLLSYDLESKNRLLVLSLVIKCSCEYIELCPTVLPILLQQLSNNQDNEYLFHVLRAFPSMAAVPENIPKIVRTLQIISKQSIELENMCTALMYDIWEKDNKYYSELEAFLTKKTPAFLLREKYEYYVTKAYILKNLSEKRPELYGKELVAHFSKILNECALSTGSVPSALAIDGICNLCKAEVIDIVTTWSALSHKFSADKRIPVIKSLCRLFGEIPYLQHTPEYEKLIENVVTLLWNYVVTNKNEEVVMAALEALLSFDLEVVCSQLPPLFMEENNIETDIGGTRTVSGSTWINLLELCQFEKASIGFLIKLVSKEVSNYLKHVYHIKGQREPDNYVNLPTHSIVRALTEFVKRGIRDRDKWKGTKKENTYQACFNVLSQKFSKPLPPLDWCFLQELIHESDLKEYCVDLASHQAVSSGSARRLVENYIVASTEEPQKEDVLLIYKSLKCLANSIQPAIVKPFLENSFNYVLTIDDDNSTLNKILGYLKDILKDTEVLHINKDVIQDVIGNIISITDTTSDIFLLLLNCIEHFSNDGLKKLTKFDDNFSFKDFEKKTKIRCHIASTSIQSPLNWLDKIFSVASINNINYYSQSYRRCSIVMHQLYLSIKQTQRSEKQLFEDRERIQVYADELSNVFRKQINQYDSPLWLLDLFGQIQAKVANLSEVNETEHFCDILSIAVTVFSGFFTILPKHDYTNIRYYLPSALAYLVKEENWSICTSQALDWLYHMNRAENMSKEYQQLFGWSLCCLRNEEEFVKGSKWMMYVDCPLYNYHK